MEAGRLADDLGMRVNVSCKTGESSIGCAAALHIASVVPNVAWALTLTHTGLAEDVVTDPIQSSAVTRTYSIVQASVSMSMSIAYAAIRSR